MTIKKGYIRTEIEKYLYDLKETEELTLELVFQHLPEIYKILKSDTNNPLGENITLEVFIQAAKVGLGKTEFKARFGL